VRLPSPGSTILQLRYQSWGLICDPALGWLQKKKLINKTGEVLILYVLILILEYRPAFVWLDKKTSLEQNIPVF
jgi:hypothetical protein